MAVLSGLVYYGPAFWLFLHGLKRMPASEAGLFINLVPVFALAGAYGLLGERLQPIRWLGCLVVLAAVVALGFRLKPT